MSKMNNDIITVYDENNEKEDYKLLLVINKEYKYLIYTKLNNLNLKRNLYAVKIKDLKSNEETLEISNDEWEMIEKTYKNLINT